MKPTAMPQSLPVKEGFVVIDARGHRCPVPTLKLRRHMERDTQVMLYADDPMAQIDVPHFCNQNKFLLLDVQAMDDVWIFTIRRT